MKPIFYLSILLSSMLLTSCYRKFDLEEYRTTPKNGDQLGLLARYSRNGQHIPHMVSLREQAGRNDSKRQGGIIHRRDLQGGDALERIFLLEIFSLARRGSRWMGNRYALYIEYGSTARTNRKDSSFYPGIWNSLGGR